MKCAAFATVLALFIATPPAARAQAPADVPGGIKRLDELWPTRDAPGVGGEARALAEALVAKAPNDFEVLWRAARTYFWVSDDGALSKGQRSSLGKKGWDLAERAIRANPGRVEGHYYAALNMGSYVLALGVVKAISQGIDGKFRERLGKAESLNARFDHGGVDTAWGYYYQKLPWPKRDAEKAERHLRRALEINPASLRARVYLAELLTAEKRAAEAKSLLDAVRRASAGRYDAPEERRAKGIGNWLLPKVLDALN